MIDLYKAAQQALEALRLANAALGHPDNNAVMERAITALRAALAQQAEPVAIHQFRELHSAVWHDGYADHSDGGGPYEERVLYTAPPRREWAPLTDEQISDAWNEEMVFRRGYTYEDFKSAARRLDDALKERNK